MRRNTVPTLIAIFLLTAVSVWFIWPQKPENYLPNVIPWPHSQGVHIPIGNTTFDRQGQKLGLDLLGGTSITMQANLDKVPVDDRLEAMKSLLATIERRVNAYGVSEPVVTQLGVDRVSVQLAGVKDVEEAKRLIGQTAQLEFRERTRTPEGTQVDKDIGLTGKDLKKAYASVLQQTSQPVVNFEFNDRGSQIFGDATTRLAPTRGQIVILLDGQEISAPSVDEPILGGKGYIRGSYTIQTAQTFAIQLNSGALPVPVSIIRQQDVDATLGSDSIRKSVIAGEIGLLAVAAFMILYYRLPGLIAVSALIVYAVVNLMIYRLIPVTLTLAGIAGFILSIGMAVDANILIFERMREELRAGRTLNAAIEAGFTRAWTSIRDSNISTIITAVILYYFGSQFGASLVTGFALTLLIGVLVSMFTAIVVSRTFLRSVQQSFFSGQLSPRARWLYGLDELPRTAGRPGLEVPSGAGVRPATR